MGKWKERDHEGAATTGAHHAACEGPLGIAHLAILSHPKWAGASFRDTETTGRLISGSTLFRMIIGSIIGVNIYLGNLKVDNGSEDQKKTN
jgi:hypothetical protein